MVDPDRPPAKDTPPTGTDVRTETPAAVPVVAERGAAPPPTGLLGYLVRHQAIVVPLIAVVLAFAIGAILTFAVNATVSGLDINVVGVILMICGAIGLLLTMLVFGRRDTVGAETVVTRERDVI